MRSKILALVFMALGLVAVGAAPASAAAPATASCHTFNISVAKGSNDGFSPIYTVPSTSTCADIQIRHMTNPAHASRAFLVLFYPSSGEPFVGHVHEVAYNSSTYVVLATDVSNGTRFSVQEELAGTEAWTAECMD